MVIITAGTNAILGFHTRKRIKKDIKPKFDAQKVACSLNHFCRNKPITIGKKINNKEKAPTSKSTKLGITKAKIIDAIIITIPNTRDRNRSSLPLVL